MVTLPEAEFKGLGIECQTADAVAKSVGLLVSDQKRHGQCLYSRGGRYVEMEEPLENAMLEAIGKARDSFEEPERLKVYARFAELAGQK